MTKHTSHVITLTSLSLSLPERSNTTRTYFNTDIHSTTCAIRESAGIPLQCFWHQLAVCFHSKKPGTPPTCSCYYWECQGSCFTEPLSPVKYFSLPQLVALFTPIIMPSEAFQQGTTSLQKPRLASTNTIKSDARMECGSGEGCDLLQKLRQLCLNRFNSFDGRLTGLELV